MLFQNKAKLLTKSNPIKDKILGRVKKLTGYRMKNKKITKLSSSRHRRKPSKTTTFLYIAAKQY